MPAYFKEAVSRVAQLHLARMHNAYDEKGRDPDKGWEHGAVEPFVPTEGTGSQVPPARDNQGEPIPPPDLGLMEIPGFKWDDKSKSFHSVTEE